MNSKAFVLSPLVVGELLTYKLHHRLHQILALQLLSFSLSLLARLVLLVETFPP